MTIAKLNAVDAQAIADRHEDSLARAYEKVLREAGRTAAYRFKRLAPFATVAAADQPPSGEPPNWSPPNIDELVDLPLIADQTLTQTRTIRTKALASIIDAYGRTLSTVTAPDLGGVVFDVRNPYAVNLLEVMGGRAGDVAKSVRDDLQKIIGDAYEQGLSVNKTATQIIGLSDDFSKAQSRMLARTDLNGLANGASHMAASEVGVTYKTWVATEDERTRESHVEADGQTVPIDDLFDVGGEQAMYPGDPGLSDAEACNCRCTLVYTDSLGDVTDTEEPVTAAGLRGEATGARIGGNMTEPQITIPLNISIGTATTSNATTFVGLGADAETFGATGSTDLPLSDRDTPWDAGAARKSLQPEDFPKAHFWRDPNGPADQITSYKFPFAKRTGDGLVAVWGGVTAGAQRLSQAQGVDTGAIQAKMAVYYRKAAKQYKDDAIKTPWANQEDVTDAMSPDAHQYLDDGSGRCAFCGMTSGASVHDSPGLAAAAAQTWRAVLCVEGEPTEDGRLLEPGSISWRDLPLTLLCQTETQAGHDGAEVCGRIDRIWRDGNSIMGEGTFDTGEFGLEVARLVNEQTLRGVSVDLAVLEYEIRPAPDTDDTVLDIADGIVVQDDPDELFVVTDGVIGAATICPFQAIANATIEVLTSSGPLEFRVTRVFDLFAPQAITAGAAGLAPLQPPAEWFEDPQLGEPTPITVTDEGRMFGHAALWNTCHVGVPGSCVTPPRSASGYRFFHLGAVDTADGGQLPVGQVTLGTGHAPLRLGSEDAMEHYDNTGTVGADGRVGEDRHGIWFAGALRPDLSAERVRSLRGAKLSGDWRNINGRLELVGLLAVNVPGFPVPRPMARVASAGAEPERLALVAAGLPEDAPEPDLATRARVLAARARGGIEALAELARS